MWKLCLLWQGLKSLSARVSVEVTCEIVNDDAASIEAREGSEEVYWQYGGYS